MLITAPPCGPTSELLSFNWFNWCDFLLSVSTVLCKLCSRTDLTIAIQDILFTCVGLLKMPVWSKPDLSAAPPTFGGDQGTQPQVWTLSAVWAATLPCNDFCDLNGDKQNSDPKLTTQIIWFYKNDSCHRNMSQTTELILCLLNLTIGLFHNCAKFINVIQCSCIYWFFSWILIIVPHFFCMLSFLCIVATRKGLYQSTSVVLCTVWIFYLWARCKK